MIIDEIQVSGTSISQIDDLSILHPYDFLSSDLFLISQQMLSNVSPDRTYEFNDKKYRTEYDSNKLAYNSLSNKIYEDSLKVFGFKSMAWESEEEYSLANHIHNYSKIICTPKIKASNQTVNVVTFNLNGKNIIFSMPIIYNYKQPKAYIGQLKFLAIESLPVKLNTDEFYNSDGFDGWVYPDGRILKISRFPDAYNCFGTSYNDGTEGSDEFRIPLLNNFIKTENDFQSASDFSNSIPASKVILEHYHNISQLFLTGEVTTSLSIGTGSNAGGVSDPQSTHSPKEYEPEYIAHGKLAFNFTNITCDNLNSIENSNANLDIDSQPTYNMIPVLMYIGGEKE